MRSTILFAVLGLFVAGFARADTAAYQAQQLARYQKYAGAPVSEFTMVDMYQWQVVGPEKLVVWPTINTAYLLTVDKPCVRLQWTNGLALTQQMRMKVTNKFDFVQFEHQDCKIVEIRPIDYKAMLKDDREGKSEKPAKGQA